MTDMQKVERDVTLNAFREKIKKRRKVFCVFEKKKL